MEHFVNDVVNPVLERNKDLLGVKAEINVIGGKDYGRSSSRSQLGR